MASNRWQLSDCPHAVCIVRSHAVDLYEGLQEALQEVYLLCGSLTVLAGTSKQEWPLTPETTKSQEPKWSLGFARTPPWQDYSWQALAIVCDATRG